MWCWQPEFRSSSLCSQDFYQGRLFSSCQNRASSHYLLLEIIHHYLILVEIGCSKYYRATFRDLQDLPLLILPQLILKETLCGKNVRGQLKLTQGLKRVAGSASRVHACSKSLSIKSKHLKIKYTFHFLITTTNYQNQIS